MSSIQCVSVTRSADPDWATSYLSIGRSMMSLTLSHGPTPDIIREAELLAVALNVELYVDAICERTTT